MLEQAKWICPMTDMGEVCPTFVRRFSLRGPVSRARLTLTAMGVYEAYLNGVRVGNDILAPGWTSYQTRLQYQEYDVAALLQEENCLEITVGKGWYRGAVPDWSEKVTACKRAIPAGLLACLEWNGEDGQPQRIGTDAAWNVRPSSVRYSEIYHGETYDAAFVPSGEEEVREFAGTGAALIPQEGEPIREQETVYPRALFQTPNGETVIDFGQEVTGYVRFTVDAHAGDLVEISHAEVLDREGNFYTENYRAARAKIRYLCREGRQAYHPHMTFFGFRYIRVDHFPGTPSLEQFAAVVVHSRLRRTGRLSCSDPLLNRLFDNIIWGQKGNFLDVPTDCPQRNERLGWTGDAEVFVKTASYNFDVERFFRKWLADMAADQQPDGSVPHVVPDPYLPFGERFSSGSAAWDDAATICPWQIYLTYGNPEILRRQFSCMKRYVDYITAATGTPFLWTGGSHYGDWLGLDAPVGSYKGSSREDFIASAFYAHSTDLVVRAGRVLGEDVTAYETLYHGIVAAFRREFPGYRTQTEAALAVRFGLAPDPQKAADELADRVRADGSCLRTGFVGTPHLLHALSGYGHTELAYTLLLRREYPSWLYPVTRGATTVWEHWDGIMENGEFWSPDMNSFNHYAYGAVADWVYEVAAGIRTVEDAPGFARIRIEPHPDGRLAWLGASIETRHGPVSSVWKQEETAVRYEIATPSPAEIIIDGQTHAVGPGQYLFFGRK